MTENLLEAIRDALETLTKETGLDCDALFGDRILEPRRMSSGAAHAAGMIEGAALVLGMTALEMIDAAGLDGS